MNNIHAENSIDVTNILVDEIMIDMENNGVDASKINENNERHNINIHRTIRAGHFDSNKHEIWCFAAETSAKVYICKIHSSLENTTPHFNGISRSPVFMNLKHLDFGWKYTRGVIHGLNQHQGYNEMVGPAFQ